MAALAVQDAEQAVENDPDVFIPRAGKDFVITEEVQQICRRAQAYFDAGYAVHLSGPSGVGKTTLAFHLASLVGQPAVLMQGNHELGASEILGSNTGYRRSRVVDNYIHTVLKTEEEMRQFWVENRLARACRKGYSLIYDEFNRSPPEANNVLLSVLEEGLLNLPAAADQGYMRVDPGFRAIFTSNPEEYAGTHRTQDALLDRMITIRLRPLSAEAEVAIAARRSGLAVEKVEKLQAIVSEMRKQEELQKRPSIRTTVALSKVVAQQALDLKAQQDLLLALCEDIILSTTHQISRKAYDQLVQVLERTAREIL